MEEVEQYCENCARQIETECYPPVELIVQLLREVLKNNQSDDEASHGSSDVRDVRHR